MNKNNTENKIFFDLTYYALKLLGKNLYSNPWTAISELVANGLDSGASNVNVLIDISNKQHSIIEIFDNGCGMTYEDLCDKYVLIGRNKRDEIEDSKKKENLLGRKGIGKLAALFLSNKFYLSTKSADEHSTWVIDAAKFKNSDVPSLARIENNEVKFTAEKNWGSYKTGTMIKLIDVDLRGVGEKKIESLKARLADFYLPELIKSKISIAICSKIDDRIIFTPIKKTISFDTLYGIFDNTDYDYAGRIKKEIYLTNENEVPAQIDTPRSTVVLKKNNYVTSGFLNLKTLHGEDKDVAYNLIGWVGVHGSLNNNIQLRNNYKYNKLPYRSNTLRLYVRGKLAVENLIPYLDNTQAFSNYIEGEISFDVLDDDDFEDISTSNREGYNKSDERVQMLIKVVKPIVTSLIGARARIGQTINKEIENYNEEQKRIEEEKRLAEERARKEAEERARKEAEERAKAEQRARELKTELDIKNEDLGSEKKRNYFLVDALSADQVNFAKKLHMIRINSGTISNVITKLIMKNKRNCLTLEQAWDGLKTISYSNARIKSNLEYGAIANFDTKEEYLKADLFAFIVEYCEQILKYTAGSELFDVKIETSVDGEFVIDFSPQDISVVLENIISNSGKHSAQKLIINMYITENCYCIDFINDGEPLGKSQRENTRELFEFGKGYTRSGTGVGLFHVYDIVENNMHGKVGINPYRNEGFELQMRFQK